jgi:Holliday junction DNA helicase RuvB
VGADVRDELLDPEPVEPSEASDEAGLRPRTLSDFVGQAELKEHLSIILGAAAAAGRRPTTSSSPGRPAWARPPSPASSPPRWVWTCTSRRVRRFERAGDLAAILTKLEEGDVLFIDEIHRLSASGRGGALPGDGGLPARHRAGQGPGGPLHPPRRSPASPSSVPPPAPV